MGFVQLVTIRAKSGKTPEILRILADIRADVREKEPGTLQYHPSRNPADEREVVIWEEYESEEALNLWGSSRDDLAENISIKRLSVI